MNEKIQPFANLLGKVSDEQLAEMAGVTVEEAKAAREAAVEETIIEPPAVEQLPEKPVVEQLPEKPVVEKPKKAEIKQLENQLANAQTEVQRLRSRLGGAQAEIQTLKNELAGAQAEIKSLKYELGSTSAPPAAPEPAPAPESSKPEPSQAVRVKKNDQVTGPKGRIWTLSFRDVYTGEQAQWLRQHCPDLVEDYPPVAKK